MQSPPSPWSSAGSYFCDDGLPISLEGSFTTCRSQGRIRLKSRNTSNFVAAEDAGALEEDAVALLDRAVGVEWYRQHGTDIDRAAATLCRLRRARAGERGGPESGDDAVRAMLAAASPQAVMWLASRAISYMDETGFPEAVEPWLRD